MTVKKRLSLYNLLMWLIPAGITFVVGAIGVAILLVSFYRSSVVFNNEHFYEHRETVKEEVVRYIESDERDEELTSFVDNASSSGVRLIVEGDSYYFDKGYVVACDEELLSLSLSDTNEGFIDNGTRQFYFTFCENNGETYRIFIFSNSVSSFIDVYELAVVIFVAALIILTIISIFIVNRVLSRSIIKQIEYPLDKLLVGAKEIASGNLSYKIEYDKDDEFKEAIDQFNAMSQELLLSQEMIKDEENSRQLLIAGISHDIKSPLTCIIGYVEGLCDGLATTKEKENQYLSVIRRKCDEINVLVNKMIVYTKSQYEYSQGGGEIKPSEEIKAFLKEEQENYEKQGLLVHYEGDSSRVIKMNKEDFYRVLANLIGNAAHYKKGGTGNLYVKTEENDEELSLSFSDDGVGVPEESLEHIFDPFYRVDESRNTPSQGNGLGLAIAKRIVNGSGGQLSAYNNEFGGLTIKMVFAK